MNKLSESEKLPRNYGIEELMTPSDIHLIQAIGANPEYNIRAISDILGITPGAASQQVTKLAKRGLVTKNRGVKNEKEVFLTLTPLGEEAFQHHETLHEEIYQRIISRIEPLETKEIQTMKRVLLAMESVYEERLCEVRRELAQHNARNEADECMGDSS
ncbi:MarR family winged helix-turn-helix transcriptional regulator [Methanospirillum hungatei]|uniref:MarR family winged helix-turn-helix transcriptional regulator n=1 Tax=Methanospirillum hungatei TaxID=2203 RepID=UPI0026ED1E84|nr:MarR family transcriptional regulator [Methanospirillum hungatei]MCA1915542.1 MarR family transcriptional regulator [Methanospirillum hungatei]